MIICYYKWIDCLYAEGVIRGDSGSVPFPLRIWLIRILLYLIATEFHSWNRSELKMQLQSLPVANIDCKAVVQKLAMLQNAGNLT